MYAYMCLSICVCNKKCMYSNTGMYSAANCAGYKAIIRRAREQDELEEGPFLILQGATADRGSRTDDSTIKINGPSHVDILLKLIIMSN